jgi:predicted nucleic acid-binding protein
MTLADISPASAVFIDANIFIYHFAGLSDQCSALLERVEAGDLRGMTGESVLLEVAHRLMVLEAIEQGLTSGANPARRLAVKPELVRQLSKYYFSTLKISQMGVETSLLPQNPLTRSQEYRQTYGLLVNDSLIPLYMHKAGVLILASADPAFDRIPWIRRAAPSDL